MKKRIIALVVLSSLLFSVFSCANNAIVPKAEVFYGDIIDGDRLFDSYGRLYDYTGSEEKEFDELVKKTEKELVEYHKLYNIYKEYDGITNIATLNKMAGKGAVKVDERIIDLLVFAKEMHELTDGHVNIAMGSVLKIWHDLREAGDRIPTNDELENAAKHTDINDVLIDEENLTVELLDSEMSLDVGAIAKGFAVEEVAKKLHGWAGNSYLLDVGGNIRAIGGKADGSGFNTGIEDPDSISGGVIADLVIEIKDSAAVTSGSYQRYYTVDGVRYHHIINKDSLMPENYYKSVTVIAPSSALADALSTAIFNMKFDTAADFILKNTEISVVFVLCDGKIEKLGNLFVE